MSSIPLVAQSFPPEHAGLAQSFLSSASWIWTLEELEQPYAPPDIERGFRWTYVSPSRTPSSLTIIISVDNEFSLHVNGALVRRADVNSPHQFMNGLAFTVPIATGTTKTVVAVRGFNLNNTVHVTRNPAGVTAAIKVSFQGTTDTETFLTGSDTRWRGERNLPTGWENPDFNDSNWPGVVVFPSGTANRIWPPSNRKGPSQLLAAVVPSTTTAIQTSISTSTSTPSTLPSSATSTPTPSLPAESSTLTGGGNPLFADVNPGAEDPVTPTTAIGGSGSSSKSNSSGTLDPSPFSTAFIVGFILLFTLWPRSFRRIFSAY